jgi:hypothetical protein
MKWDSPRPSELGHTSTLRAEFAHRVASRIGPYTSIGFCHPSQQNAFTGRLTDPMFDSVIALAELAIAESM